MKIWLLYFLYLQILQDLIYCLRSIATLDISRNHTDAARSYLIEARELLQRLNTVYPDNRHAADLTAVEEQLARRVPARSHN